MGKISRGNDMKKLMLGERGGGWNRNRRAIPKKQATSELGRLPARRECGNWGGGGGAGARPQTKKEDVRTKWEAKSLAGEPVFKD